MMWHCTHILSALTLLRFAYTVYSSLAGGNMTVYLESAVGANNIPINRRDFTSIYNYGRNELKKSPSAPK